MSLGNVWGTAGDRYLKSAYPRFCELRFDGHAGGRNEKASRVKLNSVKRSGRTGVNAVNGVNGVNSAMKMVRGERKW